MTQTGRIPLHRESLPLHLHVQRVRPLLEERTGNLDRLGDDLGNLDDLFLEFHLSSRDPRDVEQVVHQPRQVSDLAFDDGALSL